MRPQNPETAKRAKRVRMRVFIFLRGKKNGALAAPVFMRPSGRTRQRQRQVAGTNFALPSYVHFHATIASPSPAAVPAVSLFGVIVTILPAWSAIAPTVALITPPAATSSEDM